jgi:hypothetical protein
MSNDILTPVGRLVSGHPMEMHAVTDDKTKQPKTFADGSPMFNQSVGIAIPKNGTTDWKQTDWGQKIYAAAVAAYPRGEHGMRTFSWKITDGDSTEPNKKMVTPCSREGYPGNWVIFASSCFPTPCYHVGKYQPHEVIQNKNEIKRGDYVRLSFSVAPNNSTDSPGMYINPVLLELSRAGQQIMSANAPDAAAAFGSSAPVIPQGALVDAGVVQPATTPPPTATVTPAHDLVQPQTMPGAVATPPPPVPTVTPPPVVEQGYIVNGASYTKEQLLAMPGWTEAHLAGLPRG